MVLIIPFVSDINKVSLFPALTAPFLYIFQICLLHLKLNLLTNPGKLSLAKGIATFVSAVFS